MEILIIWINEVNLSVHHLQDRNRKVLLIKYQNSKYQFRQ